MWWSAIRARGIECSVFCYKSLWGWSGTYAVVYLPARKGDSECRRRILTKARSRECVGQLCTAQLLVGSRTERRNRKAQKADGWQESE